MTSRILLVDCNEKITQVFDLMFPPGFCRVTLVKTCEEAAVTVQQKLFDVVVMYLSSFHTDAWKEVVQLIRCIHLSSSIVLLAEDCNCLFRLQAFQLGVDEVIAGDFTPLELQLRVEKVLHRFSSHQKNVVQTPYFSLDTGNGTVKNECFVETLRRKEFQLLTLLLERRNSIVTKQLIIEKLWSPEEMPLESTIDVHIRRVRLKIHDKEKTIIKTMYGLGYMFVDEESQK